MKHWRVGRRFQTGWERHVLRDGFHVEIDRDTVLGGDIGKQKVEWMVRRSVLIRRHAVIMLSGHFSESDNSLAKEHFRALLELFLYGGARISGRHRLDN